MQELQRGVSHLTVYQSRFIHGLLQTASLEEVYGPRGKDPENWTNHSMHHDEWHFPASAPVPHAPCHACA